MRLFVGDARQDPDLRQLSLAARALWTEIWYLAHEGEPYGFLRLKKSGRVLGAEDLVVQVGRPLREIRPAWTELMQSRIPILFESFEKLLADLNREQLYWLRPTVPGDEPFFLKAVEELRKTGGKLAENLRKSAEKGLRPPTLPPLLPPHSTTPGTRVLPPLLTPQLPGENPWPFLAENLAGCVVVRRMVLDYEKMLKCKKAGDLGGNPRLRDP